MAPNRFNDPVESMTLQKAPPRALRTRLSFDAAAMARNVLAPAACIWRTNGQHDPPFAMFIAEFIAEALKHVPARALRLRRKPGECGRAVVGCD
jgi:hypothetical protein